MVTATKQAPKRKLPAMTPEIFQAIDRVVVYLFNDERKHFLECDRTERKDHIFHAVAVLGNVLTGENRTAAQQAKDWEF